MRLKTALVLLTLIAGCLISAWPGQSSAATGVIYLSPSSSSVQVGNDITFALRINPGTSVNTVQAYINYDSTALQFVSTNLSVFPVCTQNSGGGGTVSFACAILASSVSSDSLIANITFQALKGSGSSSLGLSSANAAYNGTWTNPSSSGASLSFTSPAPAPTPTPTPTPNAPSTTHNSAASTKASSGATTSTNPSASTASNPSFSPPSTSSTTPTKIALKTSTNQIEFNRASIMVSSNIPTQFFVKYGTDKNNLNLSTTPTNPSKIASISLDSSQLSPGTQYYYQVVTENTNDNTQTHSTVRSFVTKGYTISVTILDNQYHPIAGKVVTLHSNPIAATTNSSGVATFSNVAPGLHHVAYVDRANVYSQTVYVANGFVTKGNKQTAAPQTAAIVLSSYRQPTHFPFPIVIVVAILIIGGYILMSPRLYGYIKLPKKTASMEKMSGLFPRKIELHHKTIFR